MEQILKVCKLMVAGNKPSPQQERAIQLFMLHPSNAQLILRNAMRQSAILSCFKSFTHQARRNGKYFSLKNDEIEPRKLILNMLTILDGISPFPTKQQNNVHLCLEGQLLATLIDLEENPETITSFLLTNIWSKPICTEIKVHCLLKIITACLQQIKEIRDKFTPRCELRHKILSFITKYGFVFVPVISLLARTIYQSFNEFVHIRESIVNLYQVQDSFLNVMGQGEPIEILVQQCHTKPYIMLWQIPHLSDWVKYHCGFMDKIVKALARNDQNVTWSQISKISQVLCKCLTISTHIYKLSIGHFTQNSTRKFKDTLQQLLLEQFILNFLELFTTSLNSCPQYYKFSPEFHAEFLNLLINQQILTSYLTRSPLRESIEQTRTIKVVINYCNFVITHNYFYFTNFDQCPIGLSLKLINKVKKIVSTIVTRNLDYTQEVVKKYEKQITKIHQNFFENFIVFKLLLNTQIATQNEEIYNDGKNWQEFISTTLNYYFNDLVQEAPKYFSDVELDNDNLNNIFPDDDVLTEEDNDVQDQKSNKTSKKFKDDAGYRLFSRMISSLSFGNLSILSSEDEEQSLCIDDNANEDPQKQQSIIFAQMLSILACFKALISSAANCEKRAHLFNEFYETCYSIEVDKFSDLCKVKARLCKLYIIQSVIEQCIPESFVQQGENASYTMMYFAKQCHLDMEQLIVQATEGVNECLQKINPDEEDDIEIYKYGLSLLEDISRKLVERIFYACQNIQDGSKRIIKQNYSKKIDMIFSTILDLQLNTPLCYEKMYSVAGVLIELCGMKSFYDIYKKLSEESIGVSQQGLQVDNLDLFFAGASGLLMGINKLSTFKTAAQVILEDLKEIKKRGLLQISEHLLQYFLPLANQLTSPKIFSQTQDRLTLLVIDVFFDELLKSLQIALSTPCYEKVAKELYVKMAKLQTINYLIPLPQGIALHSHPQILSEYFASINKLENIDSLKPYAALKIQWLISYLTAKIQRDEIVNPINLEEIAVNIRFEKTSRIQELASLLSMMIRIPAKDIIAKFHSIYSVTDKVFYNKAFQEEIHPIA